MIDVTINRVSAVRIEVVEGEQLWCKMFVLDSDGVETEISLFFAHRYQAEMFFEQIGMLVPA